jgi:hypothetical protein
MQREFFYGIVTIVLLIGLKVGFDISPAGDAMRVWAFEMLRKFNVQSDSKKYPGVVVADISDIKLSPSGATSNEALKEIVLALRSVGASAVAININYAQRVDPENPESSGPRDQDDPEFFQFLHELRTQGFPVFVGTYGSLAEPASRLGKTENAPLAVDITLFEGEQTRVPKQLKCKGVDELQSLSFALADAGHRLPASENFLRNFLEEREHSEPTKEVYDIDGDEVECTRESTLVNYASLNQVQQDKIATPNGQSVLIAKDDTDRSQFNNKLVIVGYPQREKRVVPGEGEPIGSVYIHACALVTLIHEPLDVPGFWTAIVLDVLLACILLLGVFVVENRRGSRSESGFTVTIFLFATVIAAALITYIAARFLNILWLDTLVVFVVILLHAPFHSIIGRIGNRLRPADRTAPPPETPEAVQPPVDPAAQTAEDEV